MSDLDLAQAIIPYGCNLQAQPVVECFKDPFAPATPTLNLTPSPVVCPPCPPECFIGPVLCELPRVRQWGDASTKVVVTTNAVVTRWIRIDFFSNSREMLALLEHPELVKYWQCYEPCGSILIPYMPAHAQLSVDTGARRSVIQCGSGPVQDGSGYVFNRDGNIFNYFELECADYLVVSWVLSLQIDPELLIETSIYERLT